MNLPRANRLEKLPPYLFADLRRRLAEKRAQGIDVITLGIGDPDLPTPPEIVEVMREAIDDPGDPDRHRYGCDQPAAELPAAIQRFYQRRFGVTLAEEQICVTMGGKDAIAKLPMAFLNPGDIGLSPDPAYPTYNIGHIFAGATTHYLPLLPENDFLPDLEAIPAYVRRLGKILWLNYPNNPTTAVCDAAFYQRAVDFARANDMLVVSDLAYSENTFDGYVAPSILQADGADECALEIFSLSKAFCMTGWRIGFAVGNRAAVEGLQTVQNNVDNGQLRGIQKSAAAALDRAEELQPPINEVYRRRRELVVATLNRLGWSLTPPRGTLYLWVPVPEGFGGDSIKFALHLLDTAGVAVTPGVGFGEHGEGFFRLSLTYPDEVLIKAMARLADLLPSGG